MSNNGKLIVIEGACDGIGKSTQFKLLKEELINDGFKIASHHFPTYNTYQGTPVDKYLSGCFGGMEELSPFFVNNLYALDRAITWITSLKQCFDNGEVILLDRYTTSSLIYQSALINGIQEKKDFINYVMDYEYNKIGIKEPDSVIYLTAPFDTVTKIRNTRKNNEGISNDIHESHLDFMKKVYENAEFVSNYLSWNRVECAQDETMRSIDDIHKDCYKLVKTLIKRS